jgi:4-amino-4-deoxy-L-arabinose transferase-like glycosyltransferase
MIEPTADNSRNENIFRWLTLGIISILAYFLVFYRLDALSFRTWDESLFAFRAFYLAENGRFLVSYEDIPGLNGLMNTKPPLFTLIQSLFFKAFGYNELALRLPVAISVIILAGGIVRFVEKETGSFIAGILGGLILLTSPGFMEVHVARTGDQDAPFVMLMFFSFVYFYRYLKNNNQKNILYTSIFIIAACLVKSISGLFLLPSFAILLLIEKKLKNLILSRFFWISLIAFILLVPGFYLIMDINHPGFMKVAWQHDMLGRYTDTIDKHGHSFTYYMETLVEKDFSYWIIFLVPGILLPNVFGFLSGLKKITNYSLIISLQILLVISFSQTKTEWYDALLFPWLSIIAGTGIFSITRFIKTGKKSWWRFIYWYTVLLVFFFFPVKKQVGRNITTRDNWPPHQYGYVLDYMKKEYPELDQFKIINNAWNLPAVFYANAWNAQYDYNIGIYKSTEEIKKGDTLLICEPERMMKIKEKFTVSSILAHRNCELIHIVKQ